MQQTPSAAMEIASGIRAVVQPEGLVLLHMTKGMFYRANHVGACIWEKLVAGLEIDTVIAQVAAEFEVPRETAATDVREFIDSLVEQGFLERTEAI